MREVFLQAIQISPVSVNKLLLLTHRNLHAALNRRTRRRSL